MKGQVRRQRGRLCVPVSAMDAVSGVRFDAKAIFHDLEELCFRQRS